MPGKLTPEQQTKLARLRTQLLLKSRSTADEPVTPPKPTTPAAAVAGVEELMASLKRPLEALEDSLEKTSFADPPNRIESTIMVTPQQQSEPELDSPSSTPVAQSKDLAIKRGGGTRHGTTSHNGQHSVKDEAHKSEGSSLHETTVTGRNKQANIQKLSKLINPSLDKTSDTTTAQEEDSIMTDVNKDILTTWLEMTGYNDPDYRQQMLLKYELDKQIEKQENIVRESEAELARLVSNRSGKTNFIDKRHKRPLSSSERDEEDTAEGAAAVVARKHELLDKRLSEGPMHVEKKQKYLSSLCEV